MNLKKLLLFLVKFLIKIIYISQLSPNGNFLQRKKFFLFFILVENSVFSGEKSVSREDG